VPAEITKHRKQGFESPMAVWLRNDLVVYARDILGRGRLGNSGLFDSEYVSGKLEEHLRGNRKNNKLLFSLIIFQEWYERNLKG
jgi:asparagine synthase (glutamine-hydrolysing)